jgi:hypothetical protein
VIVFLGWAWARSIHFGESVHLGSMTGTRGTILGQSDGMVCVTRWRVPIEFDPACSSPVIGNSSSTFSAWRNPHGRPRYEIPPAAGLFRQDSYWSFGLSHWLLILLLFGTWLAGLRWRRRRISARMSAQILAIEGDRQPSPIFGTTGHE